MKEMARRGEDRGISEPRPSCSTDEQQQQIDDEASDRLPTVSPVSESRPSLLFYPSISHRFCQFLLFISFLSTARAGGARCFTTEKGVTIDGAEYRRIRNTDLRGCALECRSDTSCLAFEWNHEDSICYLKARSLTGEMHRKENTVAGFCIDDEDESRDRFLDHEISGPIVATNSGLGRECQPYCQRQSGATVYSWKPDNPDASVEEGGEQEEEEGDEEEDTRTGKCTCMESIRGLHLVYGSFSGFFQARPIQPVPDKRRLKFRF